MGIITLIGAFTVGRWFYKFGKVIMDKELFFKQVNVLRECLVSYKIGDWGHNTLDILIKTVTGEEPTMTTEQSLQDDVTRVIKRIKEAKENESLKSKADDLIEKLKKEL